MRHFITTIFHTFMGPALLLITPCWHANECFWRKSGECLSSITYWGHRQLSVTNYWREGQREREPSASTNIMLTQHCRHVVSNGNDITKRWVWQTGCSLLLMWSPACETEMRPAGSSVLLPVISLNLCQNSCQLLSSEIKIQPWRTSVSFRGNPMILESCFAWISSWKLLFIIW